MQERLGVCVCDMEYEETCNSPSPVRCTSWDCDIQGSMYGEYKWRGYFVAKHRCTQSIAALRSAWNRSIPVAIPGKYDWEDLSGWLDEEACSPITGKSYFCTCFRYNILCILERMSL